MLCEMGFVINQVQNPVNRDKLYVIACEERICHLTTKVPMRMP